MRTSAVGGTKRVVFLSDLHCGHISGMTPPAWRVRQGREEGWALVERTTWDWCQSVAREIGQADVIALAGDLVDGPQPAQGGRELLTTDPLEQVAMALEAVALFGRPRLGYVATFGTGYHVGKVADFESLVAAELESPIRNVMEFAVNGRLFSLRHKVGNSDTPVGGDLTLRKSILWAREWADAHGTPVPQTIVRGHAHRWRRIEDDRAEAIILPALQAWTLFGGRECSGIVNYGVAWCDVNEKGEAQWAKRLLRLGTLAPSPVIF